MTFTNPNQYNAPASPDGYRPDAYASANRADAQASSASQATQIFQSHPNAHEGYGPPLPPWGTPPNPSGRSPYGAGGPPKKPGSSFNWWIGAAVVAVAALAAGGLLLIDRFGGTAPAAKPIVDTSAVIGGTSRGPTDVKPGPGSTAGGTVAPQGPSQGPSDRSSDGPSLGGLPGTGSSGTVTTWPAAFAPFSDLVGTGPGDSSAWQGATCTATTPTAIDVLSTITCTEPGFVTLTASEVSSPAVVTAMVAQGRATGATVGTWSQDSGPDLGQVVTSADSSDVLTTFSNYPTIVVELSSTLGDHEAKDDWQTAPFPAERVIHS